MVGGSVGRVSANVDVASAHPGKSPRAAAVAVFMSFVLNGFNLAGWAARLPTVRDELGLSPNQLGFLLLLGATGSLVALPASGIVVQRLGARRTVQVFATLNVTGLLIAALGVFVSTLWLTAAGLVVFGVGIGVWDAAMNLEGAAVEQRLGRAIMPRFHAGFSVGTMAGAGVGAVAAWLHASLLSHLALALSLSLIGVFVCTRYFLPEGTHDAVPHAGAAAHSGSGSARRSSIASALAAWRERRTLLIGLIVLAAGLTEGAANDWVGLAVVDGFGTSNAVGAIGFAVFVTAMTGMRLLGTGLLDRWGRVAVMRLNAGVALVGVMIFALVPNLGLAMVGIVLWGMGAALGFPVGMSAASDQPRMAAPRVAVVSTIGYSAFLAGPPLLGLLADHVGYRHALLAIAVPVVIGLLVVPAARPLPAQAPNELAQPPGGCPASLAR